MKLNKAELTTRDFDFDGTTLTVVSDGKDVYVLPEQMALKLGFPWDKSQRNMTRDFAPVHFGGPPLSAFRDVAPQVVPFFLIRQWLAELLKLTIRRSPLRIVELDQAALSTLKRFSACTERILSEACR